MVLGATGTIGRATVRALVRRGHEVVCLVRPGPARVAFEGAEVRRADITDPASLDPLGFRGERFDALVSCLASRTGAPADAWAIDHDAHVHALAAARQAGAASAAQGRVLGPFAEGLAARAKIAKTSTATASTLSTLLPLQWPVLPASLPLRL